MSLKYPVTGGADFKRLSPGTHIAVCNLVADIGMQPGSTMFPKPKRKLYVRFEVPEERIEYEKDGVTHEGPQTIGSYFTASMNAKAVLRQQLESWRGKEFSDDQAADFDVSSILGKACMLSVIESESGAKTYSNIASISALPKGMAAPKAENPLLFYSAESPSSYSSLPEWLRKKIDAQIVEEKTGGGGSSPDAEFHDDDIPFVTMFGKF